MYLYYSTRGRVDARVRTYISRGEIILLRPCTVRTYRTGTTVPGNNFFIFFFFSSFLLRIWLVYVSIDGKTGKLKSDFCVFHFAFEETHYYFYGTLE
jgi:hypothetical protein